MGTWCPPSPKDRRINNCRSFGDAAIRVACLSRSDAAQACGEVPTAPNMAARHRSRYSMPPHVGLVTVIDSPVPKGEGRQVGHSDDFERILGRLWCGKESDPAQPTLAGNCHPAASGRSAAAAGSSGRFPTHLQRRALSARDRLPPRRAGAAAGSGLAKMAPAGFGLRGFAADC